MASTCRRSPQASSNRACAISSGIFSEVQHRTDIPRRTNLGELPNYRTHKHALSGRQEGHCGSCRMTSPFRNFEIDHIVPRAKGGSHHVDNLQLLCGACNRAKGAGTQGELIAKLRGRGHLARSETGCVMDDDTMDKRDSTPSVAERLHALYVDELRRSLRPPVDPKVNRKQTEAMIERALTEQPGLCEEPDATTWIWSDLHLGDLGSARAFDRPFRTVREMDQAMMDAWYELVGREDTIICLGDETVDGSVLAHHQEWWREAPGTKLLVLGNHDVDPVNQVRPLAVDRTAITLAAPGAPPLLLTHVPLVQVPLGCVNMHGHLHQSDSPSWDRHINVSVEQLNYRPARLSDIRRLARRLLEGRTVPGPSIRARLNLVERIMP